jgi:hypothetical protein
MLKGVEPQDLLDYFLTKRYKPWKGLGVSAVYGILVGRLSPGPAARIGVYVAGL